MHSLVIVITTSADDALEDALAPYGQEAVESFIQEDITDDLMFNHRISTMQSMSFKEYLISCGYPLRDEDSHDYHYFTESATGIKVYSSYNPNALWDWWVLGGRWAGGIKLTGRAMREEKIPKQLRKHYGTSQTRVGNISECRTRNALRKHPYRWNVFGSDLVLMGGEYIEGNCRYVFGIDLSTLNGTDVLHLVDCHI